ncbi:MAG: hypothetical protein A2X11_15065 [Bacteroidetes bacterium GWE2_42_24]|nr:MAG: hypothetical protein A2X11_15065 [Bacteroidetes bacterium GWE2_42_24]
MTTEVNTPNQPFGLFGRTLLKSHRLIILKAGNEGLIAIVSQVVDAANTVRIENQTKHFGNEIIQFTTLFYIGKLCTGSTR